MRRSAFNRLLVIALIGVTIAVAFRLFQGPPPPDGLVVFNSDLKVDQLRHAAFEVEGQPARVNIEAMGSLQSESTLSAYGWVIRREDRTIVWAMRPETVQRENGTLVSAGEEVKLMPGTYDVYFSTYGDPLAPAIQGDSFFDKISSFFDEDFQRWRTEAKKWYLRLRGVSDIDASYMKRIYGGEARNYTWQEGGLIWETGPVHNRETKEYLFEVVQPVTVQLYALGEAGAHGLPADYGWIESIETGEHIWEFSYDNTQPAGGTIKNRIFDEVLRLPVGRYRAVYQSDNMHAYGRWRGNPPYDVGGWGMRLVVLESSDLSSVAEFDPWNSLPRVVSISRVGDDELRQATFSFDTPMRVMIHAQGEFTSRNRYDYAWIINDRTDQRVWEMEYDHTNHAGGADKNRFAEAVVEFEPGTSYTVFYQTDDSHSYDDWNENRPTYPERWGVTLFALDPTYIPPLTEEVVVDEEQNSLVHMAPLGNSMHETTTFTLSESTSLYIHSVGEFTRNGRFDYGWITAGNSNDVVWEMTRENTRRAGGGNKNRMFDGQITLPAGTYVAHYKTDDSYAYGHFGGEAPSNPAAWGLSIKVASNGNGDER